MSLPTIPHDKALHIIYGAAIFAASHGAMTLLGHPAYALQVAFTLTAIFGVGKECIDHIANQRQRDAGLLPTHGVEPLDAVATVMGGVLVAIPLVVRL